MSNLLKGGKSMKIRERGFWRRTVALVVTAAVMLGMIPLSQNTVHAQYVSGNAPFINSWLVSGPYDTPWRMRFTIRWFRRIPISPRTPPQARPPPLWPQPPEYLVDGSTRNQWVTEGDEESCWAQLKWETPITVGSVGITLWNDARHKNQWYDLDFHLCRRHPVGTGACGVAAQQRRLSYGL